jgi:hypothetical protein
VNGVPLKRAMLNPYMLPTGHECEANLQVNFAGVQGQVVWQGLYAVEVEPLMDRVELARHCLHHLSAHTATTSFTLEVSLA